MRTRVRKQGDLVTENISGQSEFRVETQRFFNPLFAVYDRYCDLKVPQCGNMFAKIAYVLGEKEPHDGGCATFHWNSECVLEQDDRSIIAVNGCSNGRWVRQLNDSYQFIVDVNTPASVTVHTLYCNALLSNVRLTIKVPFNDPSACVKFGVNDNSTLLLSDRDSLLVNPDQYQHDIEIPVQTGDRLNVNFNPGASTVGLGVLTYTLSQYNL